LCLPVQQQRLLRRRPLLLLTGMTTLLTGHLQPPLLQLHLLQRLRPPKRKGFSANYSQALLPLPLPLLLPLPLHLLVPLPLPLPLLSLLPLDHPLQPSVAAKPPRLLRLLLSETIVRGAAKLFFTRR
jgi:hypothetical protein